MSNAPYIIIEKEFWLCPTSVITGLTFLVFGLTVGIIIGASLL